MLGDSDLRELISVTKPRINLTETVIEKAVARSQQNF